MELFDKTFNTIECKLDLHLKRHSVLSGNIANHETPNFRAREVDFAGELKKALGEKKADIQKTHQNHMDISGATKDHVVFDNTGAVGADGNNVDIDVQSGKLSANVRAYTSAANLLTMKLRMLRMAARGRGGF